MRYSRTVLMVFVSASTLIASGTAWGQTPQHHRDIERSWTLSKDTLPVGLFGGIGLKLDNHRVMWIAADADDPADNNRTFIYDVRTRTIRETAPVPAAKPLTLVVAAGALADGSVVVAGGNVLTATGVPNRASLLSYRYEPRSDTWSRTGDLPEAQEWFFTPSVRLRDGRLLLTGGRGLPELATGYASRHAFVYDPNRSSLVNVVDAQTGETTGKQAVVQGKWDYTRTRDGKVSDLAEGHLFGNQVQLADGRVLVAGGRNFWALNDYASGPIAGFTDDFSTLATSTEFFQPRSGAWREGPPLPLVTGEDDAITGSHGGRANGVCLAALPDDRVVIAGGSTQTDGAAFPHTILTRSSIVVMTPRRDARTSTYQTSPNAIPSHDNGRFLGDAGRNQLACYVLSTGKVMIAGGQNSAGEDLYDTHLFDPRTFSVTSGPDLVHGVVPGAADFGYPADYQSSAISTREVAMRVSRLRFPGDVLVLGGGYDSINGIGSRRVEQLDRSTRWHD